MKFKVEEQTDRQCFTNPRWRLFSSTSGEDARGLSRPREASGEAAPRERSVLRRQADISLAWRDSRLCFLRPVSLSDSSLRWTGKSCCRGQLPGSITRKRYIGFWCAPRDYSMGARQKSPQKGPVTIPCMDRPQSEARICSARGLRLLPMANFEARLRDGEASPETAPRETRALLPSDYGTLAGSGLRGCFPIAQSRLAVGHRQKSHASHGADSTLTFPPIPP